MGYYQIHDEQVVKTDIENLWNFVSDPSNLKKCVVPFEKQGT